MLIKHGPSRCTLIEWQWGILDALEAAEKYKEPRYWRKLDYMIDLHHWFLLAEIAERWVN